MSVAVVAGAPDPEQEPGPGCGRPLGRVDPALAAADPRVSDLWARTTALAADGPGPLGLAGGDRPAADVEVLTAVLASAEYTLARFQHAADLAGALPLRGPGAMLTAAGWSAPWARRLARAGGFAAAHASVAGAWAAGVITSDHLDPIVKHADRFTEPELAAVLEQLTPLWGSVSPAAVERYVRAADRLLHPPGEPTRDERDAYESRHLSFAVSGTSVLLSGELPRVEGEAVMAAIEALAERARSTLEPVSAGARRADALVDLVNTAANAGALPARGGLPAALNVTVEHTSLGDAVVTTSRGHHLTEAETRWACCDAVINPVLIDAGRCDGHPAGTRAGAAGPPAGPAERVAALAALLFDTPTPLAVGRSSRTATPAQRRALAVRDRGCIIPGCHVPAEACQAHHLTDWSSGGSTDIDNLVLACWAHHRQVDLRMWDTPAEAPHPSGQGRSWPANNGAPFVIRRAHRTRWRL